MRYTLGLLNVYAGFRYGPLVRMSDKFGTYTTWNAPQSFLTVLSLREKCVKLNAIIGGMGRCVFVACQSCSGEIRAHTATSGSRCGLHGGR